MNKVTFYILFFVFMVSCEDDNTKDTPDNEVKINENIVRIDDCCDGLYAGNYWLGVWHDTTIVYARPLSYLKINGQLNVVERDTLIWQYPNFNKVGYISKPSASGKFLGVRSAYRSIVIGSLYEFDLNQNNATLLLDSIHNISSAVYLNDGHSCIYYSYGNQNIVKNAGYYLFDLITKDDSLIFSYQSEEGWYEVVNGFDVRPDGRKLLIPLHYSTRTPRILEFDLLDHSVDTMSIEFKHQFLWLRYNSVGNQILYSNYPDGVGGETVYDNSEIGVIDYATLAVKKLNVNTSLSGLSINVFPNWSPDDKHIVYGSAFGPAIEPPGAIGRFSLYILKNVN